MKIHNFRGDLTDISAVYRTTVPGVQVVEAALAIMRLSCEGFFVLLAVYMAYLIRARPRVLVFFIVVASRSSFLFQCTILYVFPAICCIYGSGFLFSLFVSVIFWSWPMIALWELLSKCITIAAPQVSSRAGYVLLDISVTASWKLFICTIKKMFSGSH